MKHCPGCLFFSALLLAGCSSSSLMTGPESTGSVKPREAPVPEEILEQIPRELRPADPDYRDHTDVVIRSGDQRTIKEFRVGGFLYAVQVIPKVGPPYFLVVADNQGNFMQTDKPGVLVPQWKLLEWK